MKRFLIALAISVTSVYSYAQIVRVTFKVTPPNGSKLMMDGKDLGAAHEQTVKMGFSERKGILSHEVVISAEGYEDKIYTFDNTAPSKQTVNCEMERKLPTIKTASTFYIDFDKMKSGIEYSKDIGANTRWKFKEDEEIHLEDRDRIIDALDKAGLKTLKNTSDDLFDTGVKKQKTADMLIAGRVEDFTLSRVSARSGYSSAEYHSTIKINWQFYDRHGQAIVLKTTTESSYDFASSLITEEFHNAIVDNFYKLLNDSDELKKVMEKYSPSTTEGGTLSEDEEEQLEIDSKVELVNIPRVQLEKVDGFSDLVAIATKSSVTVVIDSRGHGSGFVVSPDGYVVTNHHVIDDAKTIDVEFSNGIILPAEVISSSERYDIALLKVRVAGLTALPIIEDPESVRAGDEVFVVGAPGDRELGQSVSKGIISGKRTLDGVKFIQTDTKISPGNSGSPLVNKDGQVVGVINMKLVGDGIEGLSFAIDARYLYNVLGLRYEDE